MGGEEGAPCAVDRDGLAAYLGVDWEDAPTEANLQAACQVANAFLAGALGEAFDPADPRARAVGLAVAADFYDQRCYTEASGSAKASGAVRRLVADLCEQMRCEARGSA